MPTPRHATVTADAFDSFRAGFRRSKRGNPYRPYGDDTVSVFRRPNGSWGWCIADADYRRFSRRDHDTADEAMEALWDAL